MGLLHWKRRIDKGAVIGTVLGICGAIPIIGAFFFPSAATVNILEYVSLLPFIVLSEFVQYGNLFHQAQHGNFLSIASVLSKIVSIVLNTMLWAIIGYGIHSQFSKKKKTLTPPESSVVPSSDGQYVANEVQEPEGSLLPAKMGSDKRSRLRTIFPPFVLAFVMIGFSVLFQHERYRQLSSMLDIGWVNTLLTIVDVFHWQYYPESFGPLGWFQFVPMNFALWLTVFLLLTRIKFPSRSLSDRYPFTRLILPVTVMMVVIVPLLSIFFSISDAEKSDMCFADPKQKFSRCLSAAVYDAGVGNADQLLDVCARLPEKQGVKAEIESFAIPSEEVFSQEYCMFHLRNYVAFDLFPEVDVDSSLVIRIADDFRKKYLPEYSERSDGSSEGRYLQDAAGVLCDELSKRTGSEERKKRCLSYFEVEEVAQRELRKSRSPLKLFNSSEKAKLSIESALQSENEGRELVYKKRTERKYYAPVAEMVEHAQEDLAKRLRIDKSAIAIDSVEEMLFVDSAQSPARQLPLLSLQKGEQCVGKVAYPGGGDLQLESSIRIPAYCTFHDLDGTPDAVVFEYESVGTGEWLLTLYENDTPIHTIDGRWDASVYRQMVILPISPTAQSLSVRLDVFRGESTVLKLSNVRIGNFEDIDFSGLESLGYRVDLKRDKSLIPVYVDPSGFRYVRDGVFNRWISGDGE